MKVFTAVLVSALLLGGVSVGAQVLTKDEVESNLQQVQHVTPVITENTGGITISEVSDIVLAKVENGVITEMEHDRENGRLVYEIEVKNEQFEYDFKVDKQNGEILKEKKENRSQKKQKNPSSSTSINNESIISIEKAKEIALNELHGKIDEIELEREDGSFIYKVEIEPGQYEDDDVEVYIDGLTGKVLYVEWDD